MKHHIAGAVIALGLVLTLLAPSIASADSATDAALGLGAFAVFNQILGGVGVFGHAPHAIVVAPPAPAVIAPAPPPVVYQYPSPGYYEPAPPVVYGPGYYYGRGYYGHSGWWRHHHHDRRDGHRWDDRRW